QLLEVGGLQFNRLAAAAGGGLVRVVEGEAGAQRGALEIHLGAEQIKSGFRRDPDMSAGMLDVVVLRVGVLDQINRVFHAGTAALFDADTDAARIFARLDDFPDARSGGVGHRHDLKATHCLLHSVPVQGRTNAVLRNQHGEVCGQLQAAQYQPTATCASSDMRSGVHGGSNTILTSTPETPSTAPTAFSTQPGISPATGQPGAVSVISILT